MRHIQSFNSAADVQAALNNETLGKPYVALVSGVGLDFNTMSPTGPEPEPEPLPEPAWVWSDIEDGKSLTFNDISYACPVFVDNETYPDGAIATIGNAVIDGENVNPRFAVTRGEGDDINVEFLIDGGSSPESIWKHSFDFEDGQEWSEEVTGMSLTGETASGEDGLVVSFDGQRTFTLTTAGREDGIVPAVYSYDAPMPYTCKYSWDCSRNSLMFPQDTDFQEWVEFVTAGVIKNTSTGDDVKIMVGPAENQPEVGHDLMVRLAVDGPSGDDVLWEREMHLAGEGEVADRYYWEDTETGVNLVADGFSFETALKVVYYATDYAVNFEANDDLFPPVDIEHNYDKPLCKSGCE